MYWLGGTGEKKVPFKKKKKQIIIKDYNFSLAVCPWANHLPTPCYFTWLS